MSDKNQNTFAEQLQAVKQLERRLPSIAGVIAVRHFKKNFKKQGFVDKNTSKWKARKKADKEGSGKRAILVKTGALRRSIRTISKGVGRVRVGTAMPYAKIHNEGGTIKKKVNKRNMNTTIPQRKFMGDSQKLNNDIATEIDNRVKDIFNL